MKKFGLVSKQYEKDHQKDVYPSKKKGEELNNLFIDESKSGLKNKATQTVLDMNGNEIEAVYIVDAENSVNALNPDKMESIDKLMVAKYNDVYSDLVAIQLKVE